MSAVEQNVAGFKKRMAFTYNVAVSPFKFLYSLLTVKGGDGYENLLKFGALFFGIISSPVLLVAGVITGVAGILAAAVQAVLFPFQSLFAAIKDTIKSVSEKVETSIKGANEPRIIDQDNPLYAKLLKRVGNVNEGYEEVANEKAYVNLFAENEAGYEDQPESSYTNTSSLTY